ncbi:amino acid dehydrogenase [Psychrosphaera sp. B3R10]|uniref:Leu/Phe/Val dehydrogenase n=1 Tax=unclassified Psychrosphaera TaxID=2641570 RepID=UPI001C09B54E|nr:amino acid dehydrogenase [Psychrosphaera sp. 1_MG-2023]MBU2881233.1 amino acid dehydrogenase [Psychrosphaera sp. I2R16]MBU2988332.1 amino acid dehydrogenase [Psychrosphaera sp. B3R10]MDO6720172.1 amino acid dehydrogenase [Psychrosphaera sp. 1_MG-2023]
MSVFSQVEFDNHEQVVFCSDQETGLKAIIAVHNTNCGPAVGGCRFWNYASDEDALIDVLRLSKGMTYKNALAGLNFGGGKAVIIGDPKKLKSEALFKAFGHKLNNMNGTYYSAEDVNITTADIMQAHSVTDYVVGLEGQSGNPAPFTALGTYLGIKAAAKHKFGSDNLEGLTLSVQGLGSVGMYLCERLHNDGAKLIVTDINNDSIDYAVTHYAATAVGLNDIYAVDADIYVPCALGATVNDDTIPQFKVKIIAGCANNQLAKPHHGDALKDKGILYAPDYAINAGGIINIFFEQDEDGYSAEKATAKVHEIYDTLLEIFQRADNENRPTHEIADIMAQEIIAKGGKYK